MHITHYAPKSKKARTFTGEMPTTKVVAVDPKVIKQEALVYVPNAPEHQIRKAADRGKDIKGKWIDVCVHTDKQAKNLGVRTTDIAVLEPIKKVKKVRHH